MLFYRDYGDGAPLLILHGVFGSSANWVSLAKEFSKRFHVYAIDLRNHGKSPHFPSMSYDEMTMDLLELIERLQLSSVTLLGHSMGGKVAMWLALHHPHLVQQLVVADIAPLDYPKLGWFQTILSALQKVDLQVMDRKSISQQLAPMIPDVSLRNFLMTNLVFEESVFRWRVNLPVIEAALEELMSFKGLLPCYEGPTLFIHGDQSDYVQEKDHESILGKFPNAQFLSIPQAGHWLHAEQPTLFFEGVSHFLTGSMSASSVNLV